MIEVSQQLLYHGRLCPLHPGSKRPWIKSVITGASNDPGQIAAWESQKAGCGWGLRIDSDSLIVLDLERPGKGSACGGVRSLDWIECDHGQRLPDGPVATTSGGGQHRYYLLPEAYRGRVKNWTAVLPGVDVRVRGGLVAIPPSSGRMWIESFDDIALPELPGWFLDLMLDGRNAPEPDQTVTATAPTKPTWTPAIWKAPAAGIKSSKWYTLFHSSGFQGVWDRTTPMPRDNSQSGYEFSIALRAFGERFTQEEVVTLMRSWWTERSLIGDERRFVMRIIPAAWRAAMPFLERREAQRQAKRAAKLSGKTKGKLLSWIRSNGPSTPANAAVAIGISRPAAKMALHRLATEGILVVNDCHQYLLPAQNQSNSKTVIYSGSVTTHVLAKPMGSAATSTTPAIELPNLQEISA